MLKACPLHLTDAQMDAVRRAAEPLRIHDRSAFLQAIATALQGQELGDGVIYRTIAETQRQFFDAPDLSPGSSWGR